MLPLHENLKSDTIYEYDTRIDEYNWTLVFILFFIFYVMVYVAARLFAPEPGNRKDFEKRNAMTDYHSYYFQSISFVHAITSLLADPIILYYGGNRYDQPNHLGYMILLLNSFAYFVFDSIIEYYYSTNDVLLNLHHFVVVITSFINIRNRSGGFEYACKSIY